MEFLVLLLLAPAAALGAGVALLLGLRRNESGRPSVRAIIRVVGWSLAIVGSAALALIAYAAFSLWQPPPIDLFRSRTSPESLYVDSVEVTPSRVHVSGGTNSSALKYKDYVARYRTDGTVEIGLDYTLSATKTQSGAFDIQLESIETSVTSVWLVGAGQRKRIY